MRGAYPALRNSTPPVRDVPYAPAMSGSSAPESQRLADISSRAFQHPADRAATAALGQVPLLDTVVRKLIGLGYEHALRQNLAAGAVKLGSSQLGEAWADHNACYARLDVSPVPDLYLGQHPFANAAAIGSQRPIVVVNSRTVELLDRAELRAVLGHEAGHVLADHVLYQTALMILLQLGRTPIGMLGGLPLMGIRLALLEWYRAAELTADRAAAVVVRDPLVVCRLLMAMAAGLPSNRLDLGAFIEQGRAYRDEEGWGRLTRMRTELGLTHPHPVRRVHELMTWVQSGAYDRIASGEYVRRGQEPDWRAETDAATQHYTERFRDFMSEATDGLSRLGLEDVPGRLRDWLRA
jgi:Zn-dependent protease with chaperone function